MACWHVEKVIHWGEFYVQSILLKSSNMGIWNWASAHWPICQGADSCHISLFYIKLIYVEPTSLFPFLVWGVSGVEKENLLKLRPVYIPKADRIFTDVVIFNKYYIGLLFFYIILCNNPAMVPFLYGLNFLQRCYCYILFGQSCYRVLGTLSISYLYLLRMPVLMKVMTISWRWLRVGMFLLSHHSKGFLDAFTHPQVYMSTGGGIRKLPTLHIAASLGVSDQLRWER